jgi:MYXO-CTERM domain-containing protein
MTNQTFRPIVAMVSVLLISGTPAHAVPVAIREVLQVFGGLQNPPELRLRSVSQNPSGLVSGVKGPRTRYGPNDVPDTLTDAAPARGAAGSLLSGIALSSYEQQFGINTAAQGDVQGTICDCGEIFIVGGGFPKWPLLFFAAIPLFFIDRGDHPETPASTPTPTPTTTPTTTPTPPPPPNVPVPESSSVLFLGTSLLALLGGLRRRHKAKSVVEIENQAGDVNRC